MQGNVFVTDAQMRSSLAVIRSLGKQGLNVTAGEETRFATGFYSKYCDHKVVYPSPIKSKNEFIKTLLAKLKEDNYDVLFPVADACLFPVVEHEEEISRYTKIALPKHQIFMNAYDKGLTLKIALKNNIPYPTTFFLDHLNQLDDFKEKLQYPVIIKPRVSFGAHGVELCKSEDELYAKCKQIMAEYGRLLIQEYIPSNEEIGVYSLVNANSNPRAVTVQKRIRSYPPSGGPSTLRKTVENKKLIEIAFKLLKALKWTGVSMVEFRMDSRDNTPKLMEVNPRFWGSLQLSIVSGVDFPSLYYDMLVNGDVKKNLQYEIDVECRWLLPGDILWFLSSKNKLSNFSEFLKFENNYDIVSFDDFGPTLGFCIATMRYMFDTNMWHLVRRPNLDHRGHSG